MESTVSSQRNHISSGGDGKEENEECSKMSFKEIISTFSKDGGWILFTIFPYQGFCSPQIGTTWLKALAFAIVSRTSFDDSINPLLSKLSHECLPDVEHYSFSNRHDRNPLVATHIPYSSLPETVLDSGCKIVYICRDPKDVFVSMHHFFTRLMKSKHNEPLPLEKGFEPFSKRLSMYGPYWDHVLGYWRASLDYPDRILFLKYEDMADNTAFYAKKLAEFIGYPFSIEEEEKGVVHKIARMCSFEYLSNLEGNKSGKVEVPWGLENNMFFRKGKAGDWENYLTKEMGTYLDLITEQKFSGSGFDLIHRQK
ncbi:hypothetical protein PTKIN_Ptkin05aG0182600 [Pterospermum kingtungense]